MLQMTIFILYPSPVQIMIKNGDIYEQTTVGPSVRNASLMISNGMAVIKNLEVMTLSDLKYVIGNKMLNGTNVKAQTAKFLQTVSGNVCMYNRL